MTVTSMTGFARRDGASGSTRWSWEVKTVNGKGLDIRLRLPPGFDALEAPARAAASEGIRTRLLPDRRSPSSGSFAASTRPRQPGRPRRRPRRHGGGKPAARCRGAAARRSFRHQGRPRDRRAGGERERARGSSARPPRRARRRRSPIARAMRRGEGEVARRRPSRAVSTRSRLWRRRRRRTRRASRRRSARGSPSRSASSSTRPRLSIRTASTRRRC